ncbi:MAG: hypothetical protein K2X66_11005 [Cyanobacteria bacterium]|nr:hypothetical protein [Cyanobacteriota bacterium]
MAKRQAVKPFALTPKQIFEIQQDLFGRIEAALLPEAGFKNPVGVEKFTLIEVLLVKESGYWYLRLFVERQDFEIALSDCESISRQIDSVIESYFESKPDLKDFPYSLEVSSPGLFRELRTPLEFNFYQGRPIQVSLFQRNAKLVDAKIGAAVATKGTDKSVGSKMKLLAKPTLVEAEEVQSGILFSFDAENKSFTLQLSESASESEAYKTFSLEDIPEKVQVCLNPKIVFPD